MKKSNHREDKLYVNIDKEENILNNFKKLSEFFQSFKYFILIIDDVICIKLVLFIKIKNEIYNVLIYFLNSSKIKKFVSKLSENQTKLMSFTLITCNR